MAKNKAKTATKQAAAKKLVIKKPAASKASIDKPASRRPVMVKKVVAKKAAAKQLAPPKSAPKKAALGKVALNNAALGRVSAKPVVQKQVAKTRPVISKAAPLAPALQPSPQPAAKPVLKAVAKPAEKTGCAPESPWMIPTLVVRTAEAAIDFYQRAFGFTVDFTMPGPTGAIDYAQLRHHSALLHLSPEGAYGGTTKAPVTSGAESPAMIYTYCADVDALVARARDAGATILSQPADMFWGDRMAGLADPEGYRWAFATHISEFDALVRPPSDNAALK